MVDSKFLIYERPSKMVIAEVSDRAKWTKNGVRAAIRKSRLHQETVYAILEGRPVKRQTLEIFKRALQD